MFAVLLVWFDADPSLAAEVLLAAEPWLVEELPPLEPTLLNAELPTLPALPPLLATASFAVEPDEAVLFEELALFAAAF